MNLVGNTELVENKPISFTVKLNEKDLIRFNFSMVYRRWSFAIITAWMALLVGSAITIGILKGFSYVPIASLILPFGFLVVFPIFLYLKAKRSFMNRLFQEEKIYEVDFEGIKVHSESVQAIHKWEDFKSVRFTKNAIYLFLTTNSAYIIPNESISASSLPYLKFLIREKVSEKKRSRPLIITSAILIAFLVFTGTIHFISQKNTHSNISNQAKKLHLQISDLRYQNSDLLIVGKLSNKGTETIEGISSFTVQIYDKQKEVIATGTFSSDKLSNLVLKPGESITEKFRFHNAIVGDISSYSWKTNVIYKKQVQINDGPNDQRNNDAQIL